MDYGAPRSFELLFKQYDALRRARLSMLLHKAKSPDNPPWDASGASGKASGEATQAKTTTLPGPSTQPSARFLPRVEPSSQAMGSSETSWGDAVAARMAKAEERLNDKDSFRRDEAGLDCAYNNETSTGIYYDPETRTEYIKGSKTVRD